MTTPAELLGKYSGGRVLDVATGSGSFINFLMEGLKSYDEIIGIDQNERDQAAFIQAFHDQPKIRYFRMDAANLEFPDGSFDTVSISNSLHHMSDLPAVLAEILRVLRPGGTMIVSEMYQDVEGQAQLSHVELHHWRAAIDRASGTYHADTFSRDELVGIVMHLNLDDVTIGDVENLSDNPKDPDALSEFNKIISSYQAQLDGLPDRVSLHERGEALRLKLAQDGFQRATTLIAVGKKPLN